MEEAENPFAGRPVVARSPRQPREDGTDGVAAAFKKGSKLARSPAPSTTQVDELFVDTEEAKDTPKRTRDPASPANSQRTTPAKRSKASHEATCLEDLLELGKLLQEVSTKMMDKTARHITVATRETFVRMKALHTNILEANRESGKDDSIRVNGQDAAIVCAKCSRSLQSADKEQQTTPVWRRDSAAQTEPWRRISQPTVAGGTVVQVAPPSTRPTQQKSAKPSRSTRKNPAKGPQERDATHAGASKTVSPAIPVAEWEVVKKKPRATRRARPDAVVVQASGKSYSEVLAMVTRREDKQLSDLGSCVSKVRRTINGNLLLEVAKGSAESAEAMKESIARVLGDAASVRAMSDETKLLVLEIRDIDSIATEQETCAAIASQYGIDAERIRVRSLRRGYAESQLAVISLPYSLGKTVLHRGEVRIGWTICRIRERTGPPRSKVGSQVQQGAFMFILLCGRKKGDQAPGRKQTLPSHNQRDRETSAVMQLIQLNLNHCRAAQDLLKQTVRELGSEVAILSEPYRVESSSDWVTDRTGKVALWLCSVSVPPMRDTMAVEGFVRADLQLLPGPQSITDVL
ncbi:uncharacterized protein [Drosophila suzukii]|uniref:Gag-like protein n=1 Tax=Drosophila suzukii TaxID=28584 RepID=A0ABM4TYV3_DROSZ